MVILFGENIPLTAWAHFVSAHPMGSVFQTPEMYRLYLKTPQITPIAIAVAETINNQLIIRGVLVSEIVSTGKAILKPLTARSIIIGGPLAEVGPDAKDICSLLMREYKKSLPWYVIYSEIRPIYDLSSYTDFLISAGFTRVGHYNLSMSIDVEKEQLWERMHKERRRNVSHAIKSGLEFKEIINKEDIAQAVALIQRTYKRKKVPLVNSLLFIKAQTLLGEYAHWFAAYYGEQMIACQIRLCFKELVYAWYAASDESCFKLRPNDFLTWKVLCWASDNGYKTFDFGGGGEPGKPYGVRDYKLKYGCDVFEYGRFLQIHRPCAYHFGKLGVKILKLKK